jgi:hypothetical protein
MADEKNKPGGPGTPPSPFGNDSDWDTELEAWDAALPIGEKRAKKTAAEPNVRPAPAKAEETQAPPDADAVQFEMAEIASTEIAVPKVLPEIFPPFAMGDEPETEPTAADVSNTGMPSSAPMAAAPMESSGILIIPDIDALAAMTHAPTDITPPPLPVRLPPPAPPERPESSEAARLRNLTTDGLPELSGLFSAESILGVEEDLAERPAGPPTNIFEVPPPAEEPLPLDLPFRVAPPLWSPDELARRFANAQAPAVGTSAGDRHYWREAAALLGDEVTASKDEGLAGPVLAASAVAAARAAEQAGHPEMAARLYDDALAHDAACLPALRGQLRLREPGALTSAARDKLAALASASGDERPAYDTLLAEAAGDDLMSAEGAATRSLAAAERALRAGANDTASDALAAAARQLRGAVGASLLAEAARLRELRGEAPAAAALRAEARGLDAAEATLAFGELRRALALPPDQALSIVEDAAQALPPSALRNAVLRWGARLARAADDPARMRALLARAARGLHEAGAAAPSVLPERDRITLAADERDDHLSAAGRVLLALRKAAARRAAGQGAAALEALSGELTVAPDAIPLALLAEAMGRDGDDPHVKAAAWAVWAEGDPSRRAFAHRLRADLLKDDPAAAIGALQAASAANPLDPAFWELAWAYLRRQDRAEAAAALEKGASAWAASPGAEPLAAALDERAAELLRAADPTETVSALAPDAGADDPAALVAKMLDAEAEPAAIATLLKAEAPAGVSQRVLEAAGWMVRAGASNDALGWLLDRRRQLEGRPVPPAMTQLLRRLARLHGEPGARAAMLADLSSAETVEAARQGLDLQRAEALEAAGARAAAAEIYRALLSGVFSADADLALRRVLWTARDAATLAELYRDEADAMRGAGRPAAAAISLVEQAAAHAELGHDLPAAQQALQAAHQEDPANAEARLTLMAEAFRAGRFAEALPLFEEAALRDFPASAPAMLSLAAIIDEGRAGGREAARLGREALGKHAAAEAPLTLVLRALAADLAQGPTTAAVADRLEGLARLLGGVAGSDPRTSAALLLRAAEVREGLREPDRAETLLREAIERDPGCLPALIHLRRMLVNREQWAPAAELAEAEAKVAARPAHKAQAWLTAAAIAEYRLDDRKRAADLLRQVLEGDPAHPEAFARIRTILEAQADNHAVAELLTVRLRAATDPQQAAALRIERAALLAGAIHDRTGAKEELRALINEQPQNVDGLAKLAELEQEDGAYAVAAELYIRQARFDRDPARLRDIFLRIGRIYLRRLPDAKLATGAFERVLRLEGDNGEALEALSELYTKQGEIRKALSVTEPLVEAEPDVAKRMPFLLRLATLWEKSGDARRAISSLRRAAEECPRSLQAVGELARFYERGKETMARNVLLDSSIGLLRTDLRRDPRDLAALRTIIPLLRWRQRPACSAAAAQMLGLFSDDAAEKAEAAGWSAPPSNGRRLTALANPDLEELALPPQVPRGVRNVMRLFGPVLARASKPNLKRWEVGRSERQPAGTGLRAIADALAMDLGVRNFELYVSNLRPRALAVEPGDPPAVIVGAELASLGPSAIRFACGHALRLIATDFDLLAQNSASEASLLLAGIVRQFIPDFHHPELPEHELVAATARVGRIMPKALRVELAPFAAEIATPMAPDALLIALQETAARVGLLASGDLAAGLAVLCAAHSQPLTAEGVRQVPVAQALIDFALSEEHEQLVSALESIS